MRSYDVHRRPFNGAWYKTRVYSYLTLPFTHSFIYPFIHSFNCLCNCQASARLKQRFSDSAAELKGHLPGKQCTPGGGRRERVPLSCFHSWPQTIVLTAPHLCSLGFAPHFLPLFTHISLSVWVSVSTQLYPPRSSFLGYIHPVATWTNLLQIGLCPPTTLGPWERVPSFPQFLMPLSSTDTHGTVFRKHRCVSVAPHGSVWEPGMSGPRRKEFFICFIQYWILNTQY